MSLHVNGFHVVEILDFGHRWHFDVSLDDSFRNFVVVALRIFVDVVALS